MFGNERFSGLGQSSFEIQKIIPENFFFPFPPQVCSSETLDFKKKYLGMRDFQDWGSQKFST